MILAGLVFVSYLLPFTKIQESAMLVQIMREISARQQEKVPKYDLKSFPEFSKMKLKEKQMLAEYYVNDPRNLAFLEQFMAEKYMVKQVFPDEHGAYFNIHTRGLVENLGHTELQIVFPIPGNQAGPMIKRAVNIVKEKGPIQEGAIYSDIMGNGYKTVFTKAKAMSEGQVIDVLRMIIPDEQGNLTKDAEGIYGGQWSYDSST